MVAAGTILIFADAALAHHDHGDSHSDSGQKSHDFKSDHSDKRSDKYKDKSGDMRSDKHKDKDSKHAEKKKEKEERRAEKMKEKEEKRAEKQAEREAKRAEKMKEKEEKQAEKDKDKTTTTTTTATGTPAPGSDKYVFGKGIAGTKGLEPQPNAGSAASGAVTGPGANNTIHPIPGTAAAGTVPRAGNGIIRVTDQKGNSIIIPDHGTGVTVTNAGPGRVTISNGVESRTVSGIALNISGASAVAVDKSLGTGRPPADGSTVVMTPNGTVTGGGLPGDFQAYKHPE